jgi:hypothetical protein
MRQSQAITGERLTPDEIRAIVSGELDVEAARSLEGARLEESKRQFDKQFAMKEEMMAAEERAMALRGGAQLASLGYKAAVTGPKEMALLQAQTEQTKAITSKLMGTGTTGAGTAAAMATPDVAAAAAGELGGSVATGAAETFTSAATGETISTSTGAATGAGTLGTIAGGAGAFGAGQLGANIFGEGGILQIGQGKGAEVAGVAGGVAAGAAYGSVIPGIGTVVGGVIGGLGALAGDGTVICEELKRQGFLPERIAALSSFYRTHHISEEAYVGYRWLADPIVEKMKISWLTTMIIKPFGLAWAYTMANKVDPSIKINPVRKLVGNILLMVGVPYCQRVFNKTTRGGIFDG